MRSAQTPRYKLSNLNDLERQKQLAYHYWLEDRGIADAPRGAPERRPDLAQPQPVLAASARVELTPAKLGAAGYRLLIVTDRLAGAEELEMVHRIAGAMGLSADRYTVLEQAAAPQLLIVEPGFHVLGLGPGGAQLLEQHGFQELALNELRPHARQGQVLLIAHPQAMLVQPQLKMKAWAALQKLRPLLA